MKLIASVALLLTVVQIASAANSPEKMYYIGEAKLSAAHGEPRGSQVILLEKIHDPEKSLIIERAIVVKADGVDGYTMNMKVSGDQFAIKDLANTIDGKGTLFGPAWHWTYFKAVYQSTAGVKIEDENYMTDPQVLVARKKILAGNGQVLMYMDITLKAITPETFKVLSGALLKDKK